MEERLASVKSVGEEIVGEDELRSVLTSKPNPVVFHAVVPSGRMPISQGILTAMKLNVLTSAGCSVKIWIDDCLAETNNELGGDMKKIQKAGHSYLEIWKSFGVNLEKVEFLFASKETELRIEYWEKLMDVATKNFVDDVERSFQVTGQNAEDVLSAAQIIHRSRQCNDILFLKADICLMSMDQRSVGILTREYCDTTEEKRMPLILSNFMLPELQKVQENMSKNDPPCIYMDDEEAEVNVKIKQAFCPPMIVEENPCLEYVKSIVLPQLNGFEVFRKEENGGNKTYTNTEDLFDDYKSGALHPADLKPALSKALNKILLPLREHMRNDNVARELLRSVKVFKSSAKKGSRPSQKRESLEDNLVAGVGAMSVDSLHSQEMTPEEVKFKLVRSVGEECIMEEELRNLLSKKLNPVCYDGFEPSGRMHIAQAMKSQIFIIPEEAPRLCLTECLGSVVTVVAFRNSFLVILFSLKTTLGVAKYVHKYKLSYQGVLKAINVNKLTSSGCTVKLWVADWFAKLNNKMGGDLTKIRTVGRYFIEIWKSLGMNLDKVEFLWSSDEIKDRADKYWPRVMDIARRNTLKRIKRCCRIMGRTGEEKLTVAQILYPCMQCADIFFLGADICQLGMDQRKVNVLAREYCDDIKRKNKPIILSHHMLPGLREGQEKMSKSDPSSAIFMEDTEEDVNFKIMQAYCPPKVVEGNPCLEYVSYIVFPRLENNFEVLRQEENGGNKTYTNIEELFEEYRNGALRPDDLKPALAKAINKILQPVRDHFTTSNEAKDLLATIKGYRVTR